MIAEVAPLVDVVSVAVAVDVVSLAVVGLDVDVAALTSADASVGAETESEPVGASAVVDVVACTDASSGTEIESDEDWVLVDVATATESAFTETGAVGRDADTDPPEMPRPQASTGVANSTTSAATEMRALFLLNSEATANSQRPCRLSVICGLPGLTTFMRKHAQSSAQVRGGLAAGRPFRDPRGRRRAYGCG
jgi:hypothetical protein